MSTQRFLEGSREQAFLLPPDVRDWLPADHLAWIVIEAVDQLDLVSFESSYSSDGTGRPAYSPQMMVALLLYAYASGERSSRAIERRCREDIAFRVVATGLAPDHATIARFRRRHADALIELFGAVLDLCRAAGLGRLGTIAIDGTKVRANASKERYASAGRIAEILAEAERADGAEDGLSADEEDALGGRGGLGDEAERRRRLAEAARKLEAERKGSEASSSAGEPVKATSPRTEGSEAETNKGRGRRAAKSRSGSINLTDPDSRVMKTRGGYVQGYNAQVAVADDHLIVACEVTSKVNDHAQLEPMVEASRDALDEELTETEFLADAGYWSGEAVERLTARRIRFLVPPNGRPRTRGVGGSPTVTAMRTRLERPEVRLRLRRRQAVVEPTIAHVKCNGRLERFHLRGIEGARLEWALGCAAQNLKKLAKGQ
ncbi:MAG: IS1182 family transposase [Thermoleophilia bacterium]|nr:IS1182 family transposase [Thermoleophilia bacterium]